MSRVFCAILLTLTLFVTYAGRVCAMESAQPEAINQRKMQALGPGAPLFPSAPLELFRLSDKANDAEELTTVAVTGQPFTTALQVAINKRPEADWHVNLTTAKIAPLHQGDVLLFSFMARTTHATTEQNDASVNIQLVGTKPKRSYWIVQDISIPAVWKRFYVSGRVGKTSEDSSKTTHPTGEATLSFLLGRNVQTVQIADLQLTRYPKGTDLKALPVTVESWPGREADAPWRKAAQERIEDIRKEELRIRVVDTDGTPMPAKVEVKMQRHAFYFGSAVNAHYIADLPDKPNVKRLREEFLKNFNCAVTENSLKMPQWKQNPDLARKAVAWLREQGVPVRGHNVIWPGWKWLPKDLKALQDEPEAMRAYVRSHVKDVVGAMQGKLIHWDVVNEPFHNHDLMDHLGQDEVAAWFRVAHKADPAARLYLNDCQILASAGQTGTQQQANMEEWIQRLQAADAPIGGIGLQSHFGNIVTGPETVLAVLDRLGKFGLPIAITEFDHITNDEQAQADFMRDFLTATFSHPSVDTFMMWGFWDGWHWKKNAPLFRKDWSLKPSGQVWRDLIYKEWWTDETLQANQAGIVTLRGYLGTYKITATAGRRTATVEVALQKTPGGVEVVIELPDE